MINSSSVEKSLLSLAKKFDKKVKFSDIEEAIDFLNLAVSDVLLDRECLRRENNYLRNLLGKIEDRLEEDDEDDDDGEGFFPT